MKEHQLRIGSRSVLLVEGPAGWGECSPIPGYPCDPGRARRSAIEAATEGFPPACRGQITVNALVDVSDEIGDALASRLAPFPCVKIKVGRLTPDEDVARVGAVRDLVGPHMALRVDANGAWDLDTALATLARLARFDVELAEQPVASLGDLARVRRAGPIAVAADECIRSLDDARTLRRRSAADVIVLKVQPLGGVRAALAIAETAGVATIVSSLLETSIGLAAGIALAGALDAEPLACGLATLDRIDGDVVEVPLTPRDGTLAVPDHSPAPDPALLARYSVAAP